MIINNVKNRSETVVLYSNKFISPHCRKLSKFDGMKITSNKRDISSCFKHNSPFHRIYDVPPYIMTRKTTSTVSGTETA